MFSLTLWYLQVTIKDGDKVYYQEYQQEFTSLFKDMNKFSHEIVFDNKKLVLNYKDFIFAKKGS
jgi:ABC-type thiamine transport system ATPase subunit